MSIKSTPLPEEIRRLAPLVGPKDLVQILVDHVIPEDNIFQLRDYMLELGLIVERQPRDLSEEILAKEPLLRRYGVPDSVYLAYSKVFPFISLKVKI